MDIVKNLQKEIKRTKNKKIEGKKKTIMEDMTQEEQVKYTLSKINQVQMMPIDNLDKNNAAIRI